MVRQLSIRGARPKILFTTFLYRLIRSRMREMMRQYPKTMADDPEALHDMRVGARRLRIGFFLASGYFLAGRHGRHRGRDRRFKRHKRALEELTDALGRVRDLDVLLLYLEQDAGGAPSADRPYLERLAADIHARRAQGLNQMKKSLRKFARPRRVERFKNLVETLHPRSSH
jgi:CHAD domain-containing protein